MMKKILVVLILIIGALIRLPALDHFPTGASGDEIQQGYTAYSILKTGKDEWGERLPLFPRGFGDYKPPVYTYLTIPAVAVFDLNEYSIRLPSAVFGILTILFVYLLAKEWFKNEEIALWAAFLIAISPWHIQLSRTAFEGNIGIAFFTIGFWAYLKSKVNHNFLYLAAIFWGMSFYTYHAFKIFTVLFGLGILLLDRTKIDFKKMIIPLIILILFAMPIIFNLNHSLTRGSDVSIFKQSSNIDLNNRKFESTAPSIIAKIVNNKVLYTSESFINNYLSYFSPDFFFTTNRSASTYLNFPYTTPLYWIEIIFVLWFIKSVFASFDTKEKYAVLWLLLAPIPAAISIGDGNLNRAVTFMPLLPIMSAAGLFYFQKSMEFKFKISVLRFKVLTVGVLSLSLMFFLYQYFFQLPSITIPSIRTGYKQIFTEAIRREDNYNTIIFSRSFTEPQIFVAFYKKIDPQIMQDASKDWLRYEREGKKYIDQLSYYSLGKYQFRDISWNDDRLVSNLLFAGISTEFPGAVSELYEVRDKSGKTLFKLIDSNANMEKRI